MALWQNSLVSFSSELVKRTFINHRTPVAEGFRLAISGSWRLVVSKSVPVEMAPVNVRSPSNKTFILNDFLLSCGLYLLLLTKLGVGELNPLSEVSPQTALSEVSPSDCSYLGSPRSLGEGGGTAMALKNNFKHCLLSANSYSSFEVQLTKIEHTNSNSKPNNNHNVC